MNLISKINYYGALGAAIFLATFFGGLVCHEVAAAEDSVPDVDLEPAL